MKNLINQIILMEGINDFSMPEGNVNKTSRKSIAKIRCMLLLLFIFAVQLTYGEKVSDQQANVVAVNFLKSKTGNSSLKAILNYKQTELDGTVGFYVFNFLTYKGFVIVTGDDNLEPVIAYSTESGFDINAAQHCGVIDWISDINKQIQESLKQNVKTDIRISDLWSAYLNGSQIQSPVSSSVAPLLTTLWNQAQNIGGIQYYNSLCPYNNTDNQRCYTGCVATAMAQILKYWNQPTTGIGSHSYNCVNAVSGYNYGSQSANFGVTTYNWSLMPDVLTSGSTHDIDLLMRQCGVALEMNYGDDVEGGSSSVTVGGAPSAQSAYVDYFGYRNTLQGVSASSYTSSAWIALLESELDAKRPIHYRGDGSSGGHSWVCDGYDAINLFHMNWGWGGSNNGYFLVSNLNPGSLNLTNNQKAIIGIWPGVLSDCNPNWILSGQQLYEYTYQASDYITSSKNIPANIISTYTAANQIILTPGFHSNIDSKFLAKIQPCATYKIGDFSSSDKVFDLSENSISVFPNPFSSQTNVAFKLSKDSRIDLSIYNTQMQLIKTIYNNELQIAGAHQYTFDATNLPSGIYFVKLSDGENNEFAKMVLTK